MKTTEFERVSFSKSQSFLKSFPLKSFSQIQLHIVILSSIIIPDTELHFPGRSGTKNGLLQQWPGRLMTYTVTDEDKWQGGSGK